MAVASGKRDSYAPEGAPLPAATRVDSDCWAAAPPPHPINPTLTATISAAAIRWNVLMCMRGIVTHRLRASCDRRCESERVVPQDVAEVVQGHVIPDVDVLVDCMPHRIDGHEGPLQNGGTHFDDREHHPALHPRGVAGRPVLVHVFSDVNATTARRPELLDDSARHWHATPLHTLSLRGNAAGPVNRARRGYAGRGGTS